MVSDPGEGLLAYVQPEQLQLQEVKFVLPLSVELAHFVIVLKGSFLRYISSNKTGGLDILQLQKWRQCQDDRVGQLPQPHYESV